VSYGIAKELGVKKSNVVWVHEPFNASFEPGTKHFDFDINEISFTSAAPRSSPSPTATTTSSSRSSR